MLIYHASHEQFSPSALLEYVIAAEKAGFDGIHSSDHFHPWSKRQGQSGFSFAWLGAALQATKLPFSVVCAPGQRYHPTIVAQAIGTLSEMFEGRIDFELGTGEAINETITGEPWPAKPIRNRRLLECVSIIRNLLSGETVDWNGLVKVKNAKLYTRPIKTPLLFCAAISAETCAWAGEWADGLLTTADSKVSQTIKKIEKFQKTAGRGKPVYLQYSFSYAANRDLALEGAYHQWRSNIVPKNQTENISTVDEFDRIAETVTLEQIKNAIPVFTQMDELFERINELRTTHATRIILHNVNRYHKKFIEDFGKYRANATKHPCADSFQIY